MGSICELKMGVNPNLADESIQLEGCFPGFPVAKMTICYANVTITQRIRHSIHRRLVV
jgi:hypothetical protein